MTQEEDFSRRVEQLMTENKLTQDYAIMIAKKEFGMTDPTPAAGPWGGYSQKDPVSYVAQVLGSMRQIESYMNPGNKNDGGAIPVGSVVQAVNYANQSGQPVVIFDGQGHPIMLGGGGNRPAPASPADAIKTVTNTVTELLSVADELKKKFGIGAGGITPQAVSGLDPELLKIVLEHQSKQADRESQEKIAQIRSATTAGLVSMVQLALQPGGVKKIQQAINAAQGGKVEDGAPSSLAAAGAGEKTAEAPAPQDFEIACMAQGCGTMNKVKPGEKKFKCSKCGAENEVLW